MNGNSKTVTPTPEEESLQQWPLLAQNRERVHSAEEPQVLGMMVPDYCSGEQQENSQCMKGINSSKSVLDVTYASVVLRLKNGLSLGGRKGRVEAGGDVWWRWLRVLVVLNLLMLVVGVCYLGLSSGAPGGGDHGRSGRGSSGHSKGVLGRGMYLAADYRDAIHLFIDEAEVQGLLEGPVKEVERKVHESLATEGCGYQFAMKFGCFQISNVASGSGFSIKRIEEVSRYFTPLGRPQPANFSNWSNLFEACQKGIEKTTPFRVGSISKIFTSLLAYRLRDEGVLSLDEELASVWPELSIENLFAKGKILPVKHGLSGNLHSRRNITLRMALNQMSGLRRDACKGVNFTNLPSDVLNCATFSFEPFFHFEYSDQMVGLAGQFLSARAGNTTFEKLVQEKILDVLGMNETFPNVDAQIQKNLCLGSTNGVGPGSSSGTSQDFMTVSNDYGNLQQMNPSGGLVSTANDILKLMGSLNPVLPTGKSCGVGNEHTMRMKTVLDPASTREYLSYGTATGNDLNGIGQGTSEIYHTIPGNHKLWTKAGAIGHYDSWAVLVEDAHLSIAMMTNSNSRPSGEFYKVINKDDMIVKPVREMMKRRLQEVYGGSFICRDMSSKTVKRYVLADVAVEHLDDDGPLGNPNQYLNVRFRHFRKQLSGKLLNVTEYGIEFEKQHILLWSGAPFTYYFSTTHFSKYAGYPSASMTTLAESIGSQAPHIVDFSPLYSHFSQKDKDTKDSKPASAQPFFRLSFDGMDGEAASSRSCRCRLIRDNEGRRRTRV
eukprot:Nk52_evm8s77 gene=Nk52_evmTU8s77